MDRRVVVLPIASVFVVVALLMNPGMTGFIVADTEESEILADISVTINEDGFIMEDSLVTVYLDEQKSEMPFGEFVERTGEEARREMAAPPEIGHDGYGYGGPETYAIGISEFSFDPVLPGTHTIRIRVSYGDHVFSDSSREILV